MRRPVLATCACWAALHLACGRGLYTSDPQVEAGNGGIDSGNAGGKAGAGGRAGEDAAEADRPRDGAIVGGRGGVDGGGQADVGKADVGKADVGVKVDVGPPMDAGGFTTVVFKLGSSGPVDLGDARVTVRSGTFSEEVTITVRMIPAPRPDPVGAIYQIEQLPAGAHARMPLRFELHLTSDQEAAMADYKLASYKPKTPPPGLWLPMTGTVFSAVDHTIGVDINNLDQENVVVSLLRKCGTADDCGAFGGCFSGLCQ